MSFQVDELNKIKEATSGFFKKAARKEISIALLDLNNKIRDANALDLENRKAALLKLLNIETAKRQRAVGFGTSYGSKNWAAAAACESWLQAIISGKQQKISEVESIVAELMNR